MEPFVVKRRCLVAAFTRSAIFATIAFAPIAHAGGETKSVTSATAAAKGLCTSDEYTYFMCQTTRSKKWVSVCGAKATTLRKGNGALQYRFGASRSQVELKFPDDANTGRDAIKYAHYFRAQVDRTELTFRHNEAEYTVFDYSEDDKRNAGVTVALATGKTIEQRCVKPFRSRLSELDGILKCDTENALNSSGCNETLRAPSQKK